MDLQFLSRILILSGFAVGAIAAHGQQKYDFYTGIRQMGMGGASVAVVNDETSLLLNPAALGKLRDYIVTVVDPEIEGTKNTQPVLGTNIFTANDPQKLLEALNKKPDTYYHSKVQVFPSLVVPNFGFGLLGKYQTDAIVDSTTGTYHLDYTNDFAFVVGYNFRFFDGILKIGTSARVIDRTQIIAQVPNSSTGLTLDTMASEGLGVGSDVGVILTAPTAWLPTLASVVRDIGNTSYTAGSGNMNHTTTRPATTKQSVDVGLAVNPILGRGVRASYTVEMRDVTNASKEVDQVRHFHTGGEIDIMDTVFLRAGYNQRYWTAGLEFARAHYQIQLASYGQDIGSGTTHTEDRRYEFKFAFRF